MDLTLIYNIEISLINPKRFPKLLQRFDANTYCSRFSVCNFSSSSTAEITLNHFQRVIAIYGLYGCIPAISRKFRLLHRSDVDRLFQ
ncbi:hypothetical protein TNCV_3674951 [Trichonephila clavipes]|nr:hypothetical protein TNCV_3674951 [Trichonephila clavipes]